MRVRAGSVSWLVNSEGRIGPLDTVFYRTCWTATLGSVRLADPRHCGRLHMELQQRLGAEAVPHARSSATQFLLQVVTIDGSRMCRETSRVSFLMCPFCVHALLTSSPTMTARSGCAYCARA